MSNLTVYHGGQKRIIEYSGNPLLSELLMDAGIAMEHPCGGNGRCGKCRVTAVGEMSALTGNEHGATSRLACQTRLLGDAEVWLPLSGEGMLIEERTQSTAKVGIPMPGRYGAAIDVGTTTVVLQLYELGSGTLIGRASQLNPQASVAADVMGRIGAAISGQKLLLQRLICDSILSLLRQAASQAGIEADDVVSMVITGNTTMLYLLTGRDTECLSHAPFKMDDSFGCMYRFIGRDAFLPKCMHAFVGADITCAVLSSGLCRSSATALLCDIGTNGEIALWKEGKLYVTSTAAGPAFEGAGISCGCGSVLGAVDRVTVENGRIAVHTIGGGEPVGVCGSGVIDAVAAFLKLGYISETGASNSDDLRLSDNVRLLPEDVRALQLAKAAIAAGIETLLESSETTPADVDTFYIAGGFGSHLNILSAAEIGLIPSELAVKAQAIGNAALAGAAMLLLDRNLQSDFERTVLSATHIDLGGNPKFNDNYIENMLFAD